MLDPQARPANRPRDIAAARARLAAGAAVVRPRGRSDWLILLHRGGTGRIGRDPGAWSPTRDQAILLPPGVAQRYGAGSRAWYYLWIHFRPRQHWHAWLDWPDQHAGVRGLDLAPPTARRWRRHLEQVCDLATDFDPQRDALAMNRLELALIELDETATAARVASLDPRVRRALAILEDQLLAPPSLGTLASRCGCSPSRLSHLFKAAIGCGPLQFAERERLHLAAQRLAASDERIATIADAYGYPDPLYFSARFKAHHGCSPTAWRERHR